MKCAHLLMIVCIAIYSAASPSHLDTAMLPTDPAYFTDLSDWSDPANNFVAEQSVLPQPGKKRTKRMRTDQESGDESYNEQPAHKRQKNLNAQNVCDATAHKKRPTNTDELSATLSYYVREFKLDAQVPCPYIDCPYKIMITTPLARRSKALKKHIQRIHQSILPSDDPIAPVAQNRHKKSYQYVHTFKSTEPVPCPYGCGYAIQSRTLVILRPQMIESHLKHRHQNLWPENGAQQSRAGASASQSQADTKKQYKTSKHYLYAQPFKPDESVPCPYKCGYTTQSATAAERSKRIKKHLQCKHQGTWPE